MPSSYLVLSDCLPLSLLSSGLHRARPQDPFWSSLCSLVSVSGHGERTSAGSLLVGSKPRESSGGLWREHKIRRRQRGRDLLHRPEGCPVALVLEEMVPISILSLPLPARYTFHSLSYRQPLRAITTPLAHSGYSD